MSAKNGGCKSLFKEKTIKIEEDDQWSSSSMSSLDHIPNPRGCDISDTFRIPFFNRGYISRNRLNERLSDLRRTPYFIDPIKQFLAKDTCTFIDKG